MKLQTFVIAVLSALLYALSFPKFSVFFLGFFFLIPLLYLLDKEKNRESLEKQQKRRKQRGFLPFFIFAFISYLIILYWIPRVMIRYGGLSKGLSIVSLIILAAFLSLFHGFAGIFIKRPHSLWFLLFGCAKI